MPEPLPLPWVQRIFAKLAVRYGTMFKNRYAGLDEAEVWADWAELLAGLQTRPEAISHAIAHLPADAPPTAAQFRDLCSRAPAPAVPALQAASAKANPEMLERIRRSLAARSGSSVAWAWNLARREAWQAEHPRDVGRFDRMTPVQREKWRLALGVDPATTARKALEAQQ